MSNAEKTAFPTQKWLSNDASEPQWVGGLTKLEYTTIHIAAALVVRGFNAVDLVAEARRIAHVILSNPEAQS